MSINPECERARIAIMASLDEQGDLRIAPELAHAATCVACRQWVEELQRMTARLQQLPYQAEQRDLWTSVRSRIGEAEPRSLRGLRAMGGVVLAWRALQLFVDLPLPMLHPLVPLAAAVVVLWKIAGNALAIATFAPELEKRGL